MSSQRYPLSSSFWRSSGNIVVHDVQGQVVATIPMGFLEASGDTNWQFVYKVVSDSIEDVGFLVTPSGALIRMEDKVVAGNYIFTRTGQLKCRARPYALQAKQSSLSSDRPLY